MHKLRYEQLSERAGVIVDDKDRFYVLIHESNNDVLARPCMDGERPTFLNKEAANRWMTNGLRIPHPENLATRENPHKYRYNTGQDALTPEYQLYLAKELEKKNPKKPAIAEQAELTGYLPHEEAPQ